MYILNKKEWYLERIVFLMAGIFTAGSVVAGYYYSQYFFIFTALVGSMQIIFALTGFCPMAIVLDSCGVKSKLKK